MTDRTPAAADAPTDAPRAVRWGMGDALIGLLVAYTAGAIGLAIVLAVTGAADADALTLPQAALTYPPLWLGFVGVPVWAAATKGRGWIRDFGVAVRPSDIPLGIAAGIAAQLVLVPLISYPFLELFGKTFDDLERPARQLADKAVGGGGQLVFILIVVIGAPLAEELFFRGLWLRSSIRRLGTAGGLVLTSVVFAATHTQTLQFPALVGAGAVFGYLAIRTGRLGPSVAAHMAFNATSAVSLLWLR